MPSGVGFQNCLSSLDSTGTQISAKNPLFLQISRYLLQSLLAVSRLWYFSICNDIWETKTCLPGLRLGKGSTGLNQLVLCSLSLSSVFVCSIFFHCAKSIRDELKVVRGMNHEVLKTYINPLTQGDLISPLILVRFLKRIFNICIAPIVTFLLNVGVRKLEFTPMSKFSHNVMA